MSCPTIEVIVSGIQPQFSVEVNSGCQTGSSLIELSDSHNSLIGLQGGTNNEYYHLNQDQYTNLTGTNFVLTRTSTSQTSIDLLTSNGGVISISSGFATLFEGCISALDTNNLKTASWDYKCLLANKTGSIEKIGLSQLVTIADDSSGIWSVNINPEPIANYFQISVRGEDGREINWKASVKTNSISIGI